MLKQVFLLATACAGLALGAPDAARAQSIEGAVRADILPGWRDGDGNHVAALRLQLALGWKTYWRAPGEAGIPPQFSWRRSRNLDSVDVVWPTPIVFSTNGLRSIGYKDEVILPLRLTASEPGAPIRLLGAVDIGICSDVCVPHSLTIDTTLPSDATRRDPRIAAAMADRPYSAREAGVTSVACRISADPDGIRLRADVRMPSSGGREVAVVEASNPEVWAAETTSRRKGGTLTTETLLLHAEGRAFALDRSGLRLTILGKNHSVDIQGCPAG